MANLFDTEITNHVIKIADHVIKKTDHVTKEFKIADHVIKIVDHVINIADHVTKHTKCVSLLCLRLQYSDTGCHGVTRNKQNSTH